MSERRHRHPLLPTHAQGEIERGHHVLLLGRDSVRRVARRRKDAAVRRRFGLGVKLARHSPESIRKGLTAFVNAAKTEKATLARAFLRPEFVGELKKSLAALEGLITGKAAARADREGMTAEGARAHEALEDFYDRFAAATNATYAGDEGSRVMALRMIPRDRDRKKKSTLSAADVDVPVAPTPPAPAAPPSPLPGPHP